MDMLRPQPAISRYRSVRASHAFEPARPSAWLLRGWACDCKAGRREVRRAVDWSERAIHEFPRYLSAIRTKIAACAHLDRIAEARDGLQRLFELQPGSTVQRWAKSTPYPPEIQSVVIQGLRKAGSPEE